MPAQIGDTIMVTYIGYKSAKKVIATRSDSLVFNLIKDATTLEDVVIYHMPAYDEFKKKILGTTPHKHSFWYHGVPKVAMQEYTILEKYQYARAKFIATHPISYLHHVFGKKEKEKRKLQRLHKQEDTIAKAHHKFSRAWLTEITKLEGDELTSFIAYCNFTPTYIAKTPAYIIREKVLDLLEAFSLSRK